MKETYARAEVIHGTGTKDAFCCSPGIEVREGDDIADITRRLKLTTGIVLWGHAPDHAAVVKTLEKWFRRAFPGRAYFIETEQDGCGVQVYDPRDFVKERCACNEHRPG